MAGTLKPNNVNSEITWVLNSCADAYGGVASKLFDGNSTTYEQLANAGNYIDITFNDTCNVWALGTSDLSYYNRRDILKVEKWDGTQWVFYSYDTKPYNGLVWSKTLSNVQAGRYKFSWVSGYRYDLEWYLEKVNNKYLIQDKNSILYKYDGVNIVAIGDNTLSDTNFINNGVNDLTVIPQSVWASTFPNISDIKILLWTDDMSKTEANLVYNCDQFDMAQWLKDNQCNLLIWTDDTTKTSVNMLYNTSSSYKPIDLLQNNFNILIKKS